MTYLKSFFLSLLIYLSLLYYLALVLSKGNKSITYTDQQAVVRLIQGNLQSSGIDKVSNKIIKSKINAQTNEIYDSVKKNIEKSLDFKASEKLAQNKNFDPFDKVDISEKKYQKIDIQNKKINTDLDRLESIKNAIKHADKSIASSSELMLNKRNLGLKKGNAKENATPGKYDKYKGMVNRKFNEIWQLYRSDSENYIFLKIKINSLGKVEILKYDSVKDIVFMDNVKKFLDKIQNEDFGSPPEGEFVVNLLLQTNKRKQNISIY